MQCTHLAGTERTLYAMMNGLHGPRYDFRIVSMHPAGAGAELMAEAGIPTVGHAYRGRFGWRSHLSLRRTVAQTPCDLVLVSGPTVSGSLALSATPVRRRVLTVHYHHETDPQSRRRWRAFYRLCGRRYHTITYLTDFIRREAEAIAPWIAPHARTVRAPAVHIGRTDPAVRREMKRRFGLDEHCPVIGNASALESRKRLDVFLNVAQRITQRCPDAQFLIAGDGPLRGALEAQARDLGIGDRTRFVGWLREPGDLFAALDLLLFNSEADAFGRTPMEAMAVGVPVVASVRHGGTNELIEHGHNGVLLTEHDEEALAEHAVGLIGDDALRERVVERGLQTVRDRHGLDAFLSAYDEIFRDALAA